ncbi:MAG: hypothetical protein M3Z02_10110 [Actinomycetota bacterium]|nr:hypothetical protein [Actinomycetota bacterium]
MREQDQGLTTEDMAGRGSPPARDQSSETGGGQDAPEHGGPTQEGTTGADRDLAPHDTSTTPAPPERRGDQPVQAGGRPQNASQPGQSARADEREELMGRDQAGDFQDRWRQVQSRFVDDPRAAVQEADALVAETMQALAASFADERRNLEAQWSQSEGEAATEQLRQALRRYRSFFERLLST